MGAYLSQPNTVKCSGDGVGASRLPLPYGFSAMQGWRVSMEVRRERPRGGPLQGGNLTVKGSAVGGDGVIPREGSVSEACSCSCGGSLTGGSESGPGPERELPVLGNRVSVAGLAARARPCGERHLPPTDRPLPVPSRHPLLPAQPSRLINGVRCSVGVKMKRGTVYPFTFARMRRIDGHDYFFFFLFLP